MPLIASRLISFLAKPWQQYVTAFATVLGVSALNLWLHKWTGYQTLALFYLLAAVLLAPFVGRGPLLFAAALSALAWNFLFTVPRYSFHIAGLYDRIMFAAYLVVALAIGQLTARLRAEHEAEVKTRLLAESERLGRTLLNSVSHELRTPISAIISAASGLRASPNLSVSQQQLLAEIESAGARLNRVVGSLLSAARIQSGQLRPSLDWCDVRDVVRAALRETSEILAPHPVETKIAPKLPLVKMDLVLVQQALGNLLANAALHTTPATPIRVSARLEEQHLLLEVADRGPGLPPGELAHLFDLFRRPKNARPGGTGLGLAIVKGFVEAQGGSVHAANAKEGGAVFAILLPARETPDFPQETL